MNFSQHRKVCNNLLLFISIMFSCCSVPGREFKIREISFVAAQKESNGYKFSKESPLSVGGTEYLLLATTIYDDTGAVTSFWQYKPEGKLTYTRDEIVNDSSLLENFGLPLNQSWSYQNGVIYMSKGKNISATEVAPGMVKLFYEGRILLVKIE